MLSHEVIELNKIYNMDCLKGMKHIPENTIDLIVTDPPYLINYKTNYRKDKDHRFNKTILNDDNQKVIKEYIKECYRIMKNDTAMYMFCSFDKVEFFKTELQKYFTVKNMIVWVKNNHTAGDLEAQYGKQYEIILLVNKGRRKLEGKRLTDVWCFNRVSPDKALHQNEKPLDLISQCIRNHSKENNLVFDGFMGSGTTAVAAHKTNRKFVGFELDEYYYNIANNRITREQNQTSIFDFI